YLAAVDSSERPAVLADLPVVAHYEVFIFFQFYRHRLLSLESDSLYVSFFELDTVHIYFPAAYIHFITRYPYDPLHHPDIRLPFRRFQYVSHIGEEDPDPVEIVLRVLVLQKHDDISS